MVSRVKFRRRIDWCFECNFAHTKWNVFLIEKYRLHCVYFDQSTDTKAIVERFKADVIGIGHKHALIEVSPTGHTVQCDYARIYQQVRRAYVFMCTCYLHDMCDLAALINLQFVC